MNREKMIGQINWNFNFNQIYIKREKMSFKYPFTDF